MADTPIPLTLVGRAENDLCAVLRQSQIKFRVQGLGSEG